MRRTFLVAKPDGWRHPTTLCCVLAVTLAACGFPKPPDVGSDQGGGNNDFTVTLDATRVRIVEGGSVAIGVKLGRQTFTDPVTVNVSGLPAGVTADPLTIAADAGTLTLHAVVGAKQGETALNIIAMAGTLEHDSPLSLLMTGAAGTLDQSFGPGGTVAMSPAGHSTAILIQPDGKIVIAGVAVAPDNVTTHFMLTRYLPDGTLDTTGFSGGVVTFDQSGFTPVAAALQPDGKILLASSLGDRSSQCLVIRVNSDGSLDNSFGSGGKEQLVLSDKATQNSTLDAALVQPDGNILIAGSAEINTATLTRNALIARLTPTGALDASFGTNGRTVTGMGTEDANFTALALQPDGRIVAVGWAGPFNGNRMAAFARFDTHGNLEPTFSGDGFLTIDLDFTTTANDFQDGASVVIQPDGKILVAGSVSQSSAEDTCMVRLNGNDGTLDTHFGNNGISRVNLVTGLDFATGLALQPDGKAVIVGQAEIDGFSNAYVARLGTNTLLDRSFSGGIVTPFTKPVGAQAAEFQAVALDADGRIVAVGFLRGTLDQLILYRFWP